LIHAGPSHPGRRRFFFQAGAAGLGLLGSIGRARAIPPSERVRVGMIGVGNQGMNNLRAFLGDVVAVADVDAGRLARAKAVVEMVGGGKPCDASGDFRRLLDRKDIDAVVVTTPDHWHALATVLACEAGKDVYCEKPLGLTVAEGRAMVAAARRSARIVQTGSQQRSDPRFRLARDLVRSGAIGDVDRVEVGLPGVNFRGPAVADSSAPPGLDYDFWLGPAPVRPYNAHRVHYDFRFFWDYSGGQLTNWGAHHLDIVQWALGRDDSGPAAVEGTAAYHPRKWFEVPATFDLTYTYADGPAVSCGQRYREGVTFRGRSGTLFVTRGQIESDPPEILRQALADGAPTTAGKSHAADWIDGIKARRPTVADVAIGHRSATVCHLGNIALRLGRKVEWDPAREAIVGDAEAQAMLSRPSRSPWSLPEVG